MSTQKKEKINMKGLCAYIKYRLALKGYKCTDIAADLDISHAMVSRHLNGVGKSSRIDEWINTHLGIRL